MGKVILCVGQEAKKPYVFRSTGDRVFSIEELCYVLYQNAFEVQEELYSEEFVRFIGEELGLTARAECLQRLIDARAGAKDLMVACFCSADYYDAQQIKTFLREYDSFYEKSPLARLKWKADRLWLSGREHEAFLLYQEIMLSGDVSELTDIVYGDVLHNVGVVKMHSGNISQAVEYFREAYERNKADDTLKQYFIALTLSGNKERMDMELTALAPRSEITTQVAKEVYAARNMAEQTGEYQELEKIKKLYEDGKIAEYYQCADALLARLKEKYREHTNTCGM